MTNEIGVRQRITEAYQIDYVGFEAVEPSCSNCAHLMEVNTTKYCNNNEIEKYIRLLDDVILQPEKWSCPLHELKASG